MAQRETRPRRDRVDTQKVFYAMRQLDEYDNMYGAISSFSVCSKSAQGTTSIHGNEKKKANCNEKKKANCRKTCKLLGKNDRPVYLADAARTRFHAFRQTRRHNFFSNSNQVSTFSISRSELFRSIAIKFFLPMRSFSLSSFSFCAVSALLLTTLMSSIVHRDGNRGSSFLHLSGEKVSNCILSICTATGVF